MENEKKLKAEISVVSDGSYDDYISLTDIARCKSEDPALMRLPYLRNDGLKQRSAPVQRA